MKWLFILVAAFLFVALPPIHSQTLSGFDTFIKEINGDTLVIKTLDEMGGEPNALYRVLMGDSVGVPSGRVYELQAGGVYPLLNNPETRLNRTTIIVGSDTTPVVHNRDANKMPPLIVGYGAPAGTNTAGINTGGNLIIRNCALEPVAFDGSAGWMFTGIGQPKTRVEFDNCIFEHARWIFVGIFANNCSVTFRNCYFVNMSGQPNQFNGGVFDVFAIHDTLLVENCTHVMGQSSMYKFREYQFDRIIFNHNTFVNCAGTVFANYGYQPKISVTNNIFVNCNVFPLSPVDLYDCGCGDPDGLPIGLVNVNPYSRDSTDNAERKFLVDHNLIYWDQYLSNIADTVNELGVNGITGWQSQMITMNTRSQMMFDNNHDYPYLHEGAWYTENPSFVDPKDLCTTQLVNIKHFAISSIDTGSVAALPDWRVTNTAVENFIYPDWPIPVDLSYSDTDLQKGGYGGFPLGDLNWFISSKTEWLIQREAEYEEIERALNTISFDPTAVVEETTAPHQFRLDQNSPNPFNPSTVINYVLPSNCVVTLDVYDILGRGVQRLVDEYQSEGFHSVTFYPGGLSGGVYFYRLTAGSSASTKKMLLLK